MVKKKGTGKLVWGILFSILAVVLLLVAVPCGIIGYQFGANPYDVYLTVNGEKLHGDEKAAEYAIKIANILMPAALIGLGLGVLFIIIAVACIKGYKKIRKENAIIMQNAQGGFNMQPQTGSRNAQTAASKNPFDGKFGGHTQFNGGQSKFAAPQNQASMPQPQRRTTVPLNEATKPLNEATISLDQETTPLNEATISLDQETTPLNEVTIPLNEATIPLPQATIPQPQAAAPMNQAVMPQSQNGALRNQVIRGLNHVPSYDKHRGVPADPSSNPFLN